ncbi:hypothetical protein HPB52_002876 [Rhipicephalus sanguineus]|uniref:Citrate transporter-like domain-containing protein n=1 Tax=Rhipicephalus sanguineus TaxID=34632 RepID=A0A9D4T8D4_RHISA|nr:hypothetical protein HPB52_002876 [Rhipicephalus sanguineus]
MTTVIACTLSSAMSLSRNRANVYFLEYFRDDQELNKNTAFNIQLFLQKKRHGMGSIGRIECLPVLLFGAWTMVHSITDKNVVGFSTTADDMNPISVLCMVAAYAIPLTKWIHGAFMDFDGLVRRLPWGAVITVAGSDAIMLIIKVSGFTQWLSTQLQRYAMSQLVMQFVLALCSSLLTELVSNTSAVSVLLPVAVDILVLGLSLKFVALIMILLTVNLNTDFHRLPQWIFTERRNQTATTIF